ncbi:hypothetical protein [Gimesia sp.]|uniref:hypothetical protein n=1 Tax=Gimesia sp. TaxID=2024833 RepID=UPI0032EF9DF0
MLESLMVIPQLPKPRNTRLYFLVDKITGKSPPLPLKEKTFPLGFAVSARFLTVVPPRDLSVGLADFDLRSSIH